MRIYSSDFFCEYITENRKVWLFKEKIKKIKEYKNNLQKS